jgi:hypothetical protein
MRSRGPLGKPQQWWQAGCTERCPRRMVGYRIPEWSCSHSSGRWNRCAPRASSLRKPLPQNTHTHTHAHAQREVYCLSPRRAGAAAVAALLPRPTSRTRCYHLQLPAQHQDSERAPHLLACVPHLCRPPASSSFYSAPLDSACTAPFITARSWRRMPPRSPPSLRSASGPLDCTRAPPNECAAAIANE